MGRLSMACTAALVMRCPLYDADCSISTVGLMSIDFLLPARLGAYGSCGLPDALCAILRPSDPRFQVVDWQFNHHREAHCPWPESSAPQPRSRPLLQGSLLSESPGQCRPQPGGPLACRSFWDVSL